MLSLRWYDAQGCIESETFDFLENLPLFITMIIIFQRYTPYLWGISQQDSSEVDIDGHLFRIVETPPRFQLHGRRTTSFNARAILPRKDDTQTVNNFRGSQYEQKEKRSELGRQSSYDRGKPI